MTKLNTKFCVIISLLFFVFPAKSQSVIFPIPQEIQRNDYAFILNESAVIIIPKNPNENDLYLAKFLVRELSDKYRIALKVEQTDVIPKNRNVFLMGSIENSLVAKYNANKGLGLTDQKPGQEGYILNVADGIVFVGGSDDQGAFYGLQSLRQLINNGKGSRIDGLTVKDWPRLPFRAIRLYVPGPENMAFFKRFLRDFMAKYKFNKVVLELNCMRLDRHPEVNAGWIEFTEYMKYTRSNSTEGIRGEEKNSSHYDAGDGFIIEKDDVRDIVQLAQENYIEVIPEIPSLTHGYYLLSRHHELAEYPEDKWPDTYCPSNPKTYELMFDVYDEYIEVIKPKMIHIGHDEWWGAPIGACPRCKGKDYSKLFASDVNKIYDYLNEKNIEVAMWGDFLLESVSNNGPQNRVSSTGVKYQTPGALPPDLVKKVIPKDILIFNWFWNDQEKELELDRLGFKQIYGNFEPSINNWDERITKVATLGGAPSSWAATNEFNFGKDRMLGFLGCANLLWSNRTIQKEDLPRAIWELIPTIRDNLNTNLIPSKTGDSLSPIDLTPYYNTADNTSILNIDLREGWVEVGSKRLKLKKSRITNTKPVVAVTSIGVEAAMGVENDVLGIEINEDVSSLIFLHAVAQPAGNQKAYFNLPNYFDTADLLGWYEVVYEDGFKEIIPIQYGVNILEWNTGDLNKVDPREGEDSPVQRAYAYNADPINISSSNTPAMFYAFEWVNPRFGKVVKQVSLIGSKNYQSIQQDYGKPVAEPMKSNAIFLTAITKVKKRIPNKPID